MKIFLFYFEMAIKITGSAQNYRVGRVSGNILIFFLGLKHRGIVSNLPSIECAYLNCFYMYCGHL